MAKSKRRRQKNSAPNLPKATLARARELAESGEEETVDDSPETTAEVEAAAPAKKERNEERNAIREERRQQRRRTAQAQPMQFTRSRKDGDNDNERMAELLANPTKIVTVEELQQDYRYVIADLRSMGILAAILMVVLVILAQFI